MLKLIGIVCAIGSITFDLLSYYKQIAKTLKTKKSSQVSSTAYMMKLGHYTCSVIALMLFSNWAGLTMEMFAFAACLVCFRTRYKVQTSWVEAFSFGK